MQKIKIQNWRGAITGFIYLEDNGNKKVTDWRGKILGYYKADRDITTDWTGKIIARGDIAASLIPSDPS